MKTIYLGADHAGFELKENVKKWLEQKHIPYQDCGNTVLDKNDDYPDFGAVVGRKVVRHKSFGLLFCGSAEGICIAANKIKGVRAVAVWKPRLAQQSREHNNANVLCLSGGRTLKRVSGMGLSLSQATTLIQRFLTTPFSKAPRHVRRLHKIKKLEQ